MYVQCLSINHQLCCLWQIFSDFPIHILAAVCTDWHSQLALNNYYLWFSEIVLIFIHDAGEESILSQRSAGCTVNITQLEIRIRVSDLSLRI